MSALSEINSKRLFNTIYENLGRILHELYFDPRDTITFNIALNITCKYLLKFDNIIYYNVNCDKIINTPKSVDDNDLILDISYTQESGEKTSFIFSLNDWINKYN